MTLCEELREGFLKEVEELIEVWKKKATLLESEGAKDEAILENIKINIGEVFCTLFNVSYKKSFKNDEDDNSNLKKLGKAYFDFFDKIPDPWKKKMAKDKEFNMMEEYYKEQIKLETAELIKNIFIKHYDRFCMEV